MQLKWTQNASDLLTVFLWTTQNMHNQVITKILYRSFTTTTTTPPQLSQPTGILRPENTPLPTTQPDRQNTQIFIHRWIPNNTVYGNTLRNVPQMEDIARPC